MTNPFEDAAFKAAMAARGIVHRPGLAKQTLAELAPLMADEGIDLDNLGEGVDLETINAALARASARHNLELFTPVGERRTQALDVLRQFSDALWREDRPAALAVLDAIGPDPAAGRPAAADVIGVGLGALDSWYTDPRLASQLLGFSIPRWQGQIRTAAKTMVLRAQGGQAFASLDELIVRYGGLCVMKATALAVATSVAAVAGARGSSVTAVAAELLSAGDSARNVVPLRPAGLEVSAPITARHQPLVRSGRGRKGGRVSGNPARRVHPHGDLHTQREFETWLLRQAEIAAPNVADEIELFGELVQVARRAGINPLTPAGLEWLVDEALQLDDEEDPLYAILGTCHDYVHFRLDTAADPRVWDEAHEVVEAALSEFDPASTELFEVIAAAAQLDPDERRAALAQTKVVAAVSELLRWIGRGRKTSPSGGVRRADIAAAAALLGVSAVGVNRRYGEAPDAAALIAVDGVPDETIRAMSMQEVPLLAPWWDALRSIGLIAINSTGVRPGPDADEWLAEPTPPLRLAELVVAIFLSRLLRSDLDYGFWEDRVMILAVARLLQAVCGDGTQVEFAADERDELLRTRVERRLQQVADLGLIVPSAEGGWVAPELLRGAVAAGLIATLSALEAPEDDEE